MKYFKVALFIVLVSLSYTASAQANNEVNNKKDKSRAHVQTVNGQSTLVLSAGHSAIELKIEADTWRQLDSIVDGPWGSAIKLKDVDGDKVDVAKANVNSAVGLMFTSGSKCAVLRKEDLDALKQ